MHERLEAILCSRYPKIFSTHDNNSIWMFGFECSDGWYRLIEATCTLIQQHTDKMGGEPVVASQLKEKFGGLRFYYRGGDSYTAVVVELAELLSEHICEICGAPGRTKESKGWLRTRCSAHEQQTGHSTSAYSEPILLQPPLAEILEATLELFALDARAASIWLTTPARALGLSTPINHFITLEGCQQVLTLLVRLSAEYRRNAP